jgi:hypothetical protein
MPNIFSPGSFTKNFSWKKDPLRLHRSIRRGFLGRLQPATRASWRENCDLNNPDLELIPMNFFLYSKEGIEDDYIMVDLLVERAVRDSYDKDFANLTLFAFHLANTGTWQKSNWVGGDLAGWANLYIRESAWKNGDWMHHAFERDALKKFIDQHLKGTFRTKTKILTNYRFMLENAGVLAGDELQPRNLTGRWPIFATQLFWDRQIFDGALPETADLRTLERSFFRHEIHKLIRCDEDQGRAFVVGAFREYSQGRMANRFEQLKALRHLLAVAA